VNIPQKHIIISTLPPHPAVPYSMYDAIAAVSEYGNIYEAFEQLRAQASQIGADAVVGVQIAISTFYGATSFNTKQRVVLIGTPIKFLPQSSSSPTTMSP
jgi:putative heavy-metal-binding protein